MAHYLIQRGFDPDNWKTFRAKNDKEAKQKAKRRKPGFKLLRIWCGGSRPVV